MTKTLFTLICIVVLVTNGFGQEYSFYSNLMKIGRCGSNISGTPREINSTIIINEADKKIAVYFEDNSPIFDLDFFSVKPDDTSTGVTIYQIKNNTAGIQTVIVDRDPLRNIIVFVKTDKNCILFGGLK